MDAYLFSTRAAADGSGPPVGTRIVGLVEEFGWAERAALRTTRLAVLPDNVRFEDAAAMPIPGLTALRALRRGGLLLEKPVMVTGAHRRRRHDRHDSFDSDWELFPLSVVGLPQPPKEETMRTFMTTIAAAALGVGVLVSAAPASAQVGVEIGVPGVGVRVGEPEHRYRDRDRDRNRVRAQDENTGSCRTIRERYERDDGTVVTRSVRRCD